MMRHRQRSELTQILTLLQCKLHKQLSGRKRSKVRDMTHEEIQKAVKKKDFRDKRKATRQKLLQKWKGATSKVQGICCFSVGGVKQ